MGGAIKCKLVIVDFYIMLCNYIVIISPWMSFAAFKLYVGHRSVVFICRSAVECFNCKWPLYSVTADRARKNCLCRCGTEERQTKQSNKAQWIAYHQRTPKLSGRRQAYCFCSVRSVSPLSTIFMVFGIVKEYCSRLLFLPDSFTYSTFSWICIVSLEANNRRLLFRIIIF